MSKNGKSQPGNQHGIKLKDPNVRQEAYRQYCEHIASGMPKEAFFFNHPEHSVCYKTMDRYLQESPSEFPSYLLEQAKAARFKHWLDEGQTLMKGGYKGGSPVVWQTIMRNIFRSEGWDREQLVQENKSHVEKLAQSIRNDSIEQAERSDCEVEQAD